MRPAVSDLGMRSLGMNDPGMLDVVNNIDTGGEGG